MGWQQAGRQTKPWKNVSFSFRGHIYDLSSVTVYITFRNNIKTTESGSKWHWSYSYSATFCWESGIHQTIWPNQAHPTWPLVYTNDTSNRKMCAATLQKLLRKCSMSMTKNVKHPLAFKVLIWIFAITRNICNHSDSTQAPAPGLHTHHSGVDMHYKHDMMISWLVACSLLLCIITFLYFENAK